jgi:hypothetical protein
VFAVITGLDLFRLPRARVLLEARGVPGRIADALDRRRGEVVVPEPPTFRIRDPAARGWILLGERPGSQLVFGQVGMRGGGGGLARAAGDLAQHEGQRYLASLTGESDGSATSVRPAAGRCWHAAGGGERCASSKCHCGTARR